MAKTMTDWSALNRFKGKTVEETPPPPATPSADDAAAREVMAFFTKSDGAASKKGRPAAVVPHGGTSERIGRAASIAAAEAALRTELESLKGELAAARAARDEAEAAADERAEAAAAAEQRAAEVEQRAEAAASALADAQIAAGEFEKVQGELDNVKGECSKLREKLKQAEERLQAEVQQNAEKAADKTAVVSGLLEVPPEFAEAFDGELREMVVAALKDSLNASINGGRQRRSTVLSAVLEANPATGELSRRRAALKQLMKDAGYYNDPQALEALGFKLISGHAHWKLEYADVRMTLSKTPSDFRANRNSATEMGNRCF